MNKAELVAQQLLGAEITKKQWGSAMYNVLVEGLTGDGVTDDTAKLQALVDKAIAAGRKAIFFPHGTYYVTAITNADQVVFFGDNASFVGGYTGTINQLGAGGGGGSKDELYFDVQDYGAVGDGVTDDTRAIQDTITALTAAGGGVLFFPAGTYLVSGVGAFIFQITAPAKIRGAGIVSTIRASATTPSTTDIFYISPNMSIGGEFYGIQDLLMYPMATTAGRHAVHLDVSAAGQFMSQFYISDVYIAQHGGNALKVTNAEGKADGLFTSTFERCKLYGGVNFERAGDSIVLRDVVLAGKGRGLTAIMVALPAQYNFASQLILENCNITSDGGAVLVQSAKNVSIVGGNIEQTQLLNGAVIDVSGDVNEVVNFNMEKTHLTVFGASGAGCNNVRIGNVNHASVDKCVFANETGGTNILIDALARNVDIGSKNIFESGAKVVDNGTGTMGVLKPLTLANAWVEYNSTYYSTVGVIKRPDGTVKLKGIVMNGASAAGTVITTLPAGFRPEKIEMAVVANSNAGVYLGIVNVHPDGRVTIESGGNTYLNLGDISFIAA